MTYRPGARPRRKPTRLTSLIKKLDRIFSEYIRRRDSDSNGLCRCCTCGTPKPWKEMHAGHYVGREAKNTRWEEWNVHAQCPNCNTFHEGRKPEYTLFLIGRYGPEVIEQLVVAGKRPRKWKPVELEVLIANYQEELKHMNGKEEHDDETVDPRRRALPAAVVPEVRHPHTCGDPGPPLDGDQEEGISSGTTQDPEAPGPRPQTSRGQETEVGMNSATIHQVLDILTDDEVRPMVDKVVDAAESYGPILYRLSHNMAMATVDIRIACVRRFEEAGFTREEAIYMTMDEWLGWKKRFSRSSQRKT